MADVQSWRPKVFTVFVNTEDRKEDTPETHHSNCQWTCLAQTLQGRRFASNMDSWMCRVRLAPHIFDSFSWLAWPQVFRERSVLGSSLLVFVDSEKLQQQFQSPGSQGCIGSLMKDGTKIPALFAGCTDAQLHATTKIDTKWRQQKVLIFLWRHFLLIMLQEGGSCKDVLIEREQSTRIGFLQ